jgi:hypothetical protein
MNLIGKRVRLEPLLDIDYLINLAYEDNKHLYTKEELNKLIDENFCEFWSIYLDGTRRGVAGYFVVSGVWILEALKDKSIKGTGISYSIEVGNLILDYMFQKTNKVRTSARIEDKGIQILCLKLGFKEIFRKDNLVIYEKER